MPGPWEKFAAPASAPAAEQGPWSKFAAPAAPDSDTRFEQYKEPEGFVHSTLRKTAEKMSLENILRPLSDIDKSLAYGDINWDAVNQLIPHPIDFAKDTYEKLAEGDYSGAVSNVLPFLLMKGAPEATEGITARAAAATDAAKATLGPLGKAAAGAAPYLPYGIGKFARAGKKFADIYNQAKAAQKATAEEAANAAKGTSSTNIPTETRIDTKISPEAASSALGTTKPATIHIEPGTANAGNNFGILDAETQRRLAKAAQSGELEALPAGKRVEIVNAVKAGDSEAVHGVLDSLESVQRHKVDAANKIAILVKFAQDHQIDLDAVPLDKRQALADGAVAYAKLKGYGTPPRSGKYVGISDSTLEAVKRELSKMK